MVSHINQHRIDSETPHIVGKAEKTTQVRLACVLCARVCSLQTLRRLWAIDDVGPKSVIAVVSIGIPPTRISTRKRYFRSMMCGRGEKTRQQVVENSLRVRVIRTDRACLHVYS